MSVAATVANAAWGMASAPAYAAFRAALSDPRRAQLALLRRYVRNNAATAFGKEHGFEKIDSLEAFRRRVPVRDYDATACWIDRIAAGEQRVLTVEPVIRLVPSSGSTRSAKLIPYTAALHEEFNRAIGPWIIDLYRGTPELMMGCAYWSITPVAHPPARTARSAVPVGFEEDSAYLGSARKRLVDAVMAVPSAVRHLGDIETFRYVTARFLLAGGDLRLISVWHPSFLEFLLDTCERRWQQLVEDIRGGTLSPPHADPQDATLRALRRGLRPDDRRARELSAAGPGNLRGTWPRLKLVSCWADAHSAAPAEALGKRLPHVSLQPKGVLATEAFVSIPFERRWPLAVRSHFLEFEDDDGRTFAADDLRPGGEYGVILTTGGGLYRYRLGDRVRCDALLGRTPSVRLVGRQDLVVDRFGEKLSEGFAAGVIRDLFSEFGTAAQFAMLAPDGSTPPCYTLFVEPSRQFPTDAAARLDQLLSANPHYAYCRSLGQLGPARVFHVARDGYTTYAHRRRAEGRRLGDVKPLALDSATDWASEFVELPPDRVQAARTW